MRADPPASPKRNVFVIEDQPLLLQGIKAVIDAASDLCICGTVASGRDALDCIGGIQPHAVLLELSLGDCSGLELIKHFRARDFSPPILVLSHLDESVYAERTLKAGANGYLMKREPVSRLIDGIRTVMDGGIFLSDRMSRLLLKRLTGKSDACDRSSISQLTDRELEVFERIGLGLSPREIAKTLGISVKTVDTHRANIKEKLRLADNTNLVRTAIRWVEAGTIVGQHSYDSRK